MDLEPVGAAAVPRASLGHAYADALLEAAGFAGGTVLLVDDASPAVLTRSY